MTSNLKPETSSLNPKQQIKKLCTFALRKINFYISPTNYKMKVDQKGHTVTIKDTQGDFNAFLDKVTTQFKTFEKQNIIIDLTATAVSEKEVKSFLALSKQQKKAKKSFVVVVNDLDFNAISDKLIVVPSLLEAHDIIEMEEIERDLGF